MKIKQKFKKIMKINAVLICTGLVFGLCSFAPTITAKTVFKTLAFDKKINTEQDFARGQFNNLKLEEKAGDIEISLSNNEGGVYISPIVQAPFDATHVGLHWEEELTEGSSIIVYLRTSNDGENFGEWVRTTAERDMGRNGRDTEEIFAALVGVKKADFAQAKIEFISEKGISPKLKALAFTFLNSEDESETTRKLSFVPRSAAYGIGVEKTSPNGQSINVISREDWDANESYRDAGDESEEWPRSYHGTRKLVVHHTADAGSNGVTNLETNKATVRSIYYYHAVTQGWGDIGYNALVDGDGNIYEGRYGTHGEDHTRSNPSADEIMVLDVDGGHVSSYNSGSFGISAMGNFTSFDVPTTQLTALKEALAFVADSRGIYADGNSDFRRYDGAWHYGLRNVSAHRDSGQTACPGDELYLEMTGIRTYIDNLTLPNLANFSATANLISAGGAGGDNIGSSTVVLSWSQFSGAAEYQYALEKVVGIVGVASTSEEWEVAWLNSENPNMATTSGTSVSIAPNDLDEESNYVFYVRAIDSSGTPTSSVSHVNFAKDENNIIIDNLSDCYTSIVSGTVWTNGNSVSNFYARNYQTHTSGSGSNIFGWSPNLFKEGDYDVFVWYTAASDRTNKAPYTVFYQDASGGNHDQTILVNQKVNGGQWVSLGTFYFKTEGDAEVQLSDDTRSGYSIADAVKFSWDEGGEESLSVPGSGQARR